MEEYLSNRDDLNWKLPTKAETPLQTSYRPELDVSPELQPTDAAYYMFLIGMLRCIAELGRVDVWTSVLNAILCPTIWLCLGREKYISYFRSLRT